MTAKCSASARCTIVTGCTRCIPLRLELETRNVRPVRRCNSNEKNATCRQLYIARVSYELNSLLARPTSLAPSLGADRMDNRSRIQPSDGSIFDHGDSMCAGPLKKICHWGPLSALGIIKIITFMTIHCSRQWWSPQESIAAASSFLLFFCLSGSTLYHFMSAIFIGPGYLAPRWMPETATDTQFLQYCTICEGYKAPRSHHCRRCGRCVMKMDHHCPWINTCVGHYNHGHFAAFLASAVGGCCVSTVILVSWVTTVLSLKPLPFPPPTIFILILAVFSIGLSIGVVFAVGMLLYFQVLAIVRNRTEIEDWILEKARYRRDANSNEYVHPYSKGWYFNVSQVLTWDFSCVGDGITWPVIDGCDQYTITREQLAQKLDKRKRSRRYRIIKAASGSIFPISHGFGVLCHPPCTDEPRIKLDVEDVVVVTRWKKYWLFGEKEQKGDTKLKRIRGWLPQPCAIEVIENTYDMDKMFKDD